MLEGLARIIRVSGKDRPPYLCPTIRRGSGTWKALDAGTLPHVKTGGFAAAMSRMAGGKGISDVEHVWVWVAVNNLSQTPFISQELLSLPCT